MKNILLVVPRLNIGGAESYVAEVARSLKQQGWNVYTASGGGMLAQQLCAEGIKHFFVPIRFNKYLAAFLLSRIVKKHHIDIVHANSEAAGIAAVLTRSCLGVDVPIIYTAHGIMPSKVKKYINQCDAIVSVSRFSREQAVKEGFDAQKIEVIYNGIDTEKFRPGRQDGALLRQKYGIPHDAFTMIITSRIKNLRNKGHKHLLDIMHHYEKASSWHLIIIGKGRGMTDLRHLIKKYGLENRVHLLGHKNDVENYLDMADAVVLPSYFETFGLVLAEGMAMAKPAAAFAVGGIPEVIDDGRTGFLAPMGDDKALFDKLNFLAEHRDICRQMGQAAREKIKADFSKEMMMEKLLKVYEKCL